jgi:hypothetical protein
MTNRETVKHLFQSVLTRLENQKSITFPPRLRQVIVEEVSGLIGPAIMTEQDLREKTIAKVGARAEILNDSQFTDSDKYKTAKSIVRASFGDDEMEGLFFQKPIKHIARSLREYLMRSPHIEDVFETDEDLEQKIVEIVQHFKPGELH